MALHKRCSKNLPPLLKGGEQNPLYCASSPRCDHFYHYDFRVNGRRYRASTDTADKQKAKDIEAKERTRILEGKHGIRRQPGITFADFAKTYMKDHADLHKRSAERDRYILKVLNKAFGSTVLHQITPHRIAQFKRERLAGRWRGHGTKGTGRPIQPATVNRELDTLKSILSKAVEWGKLIESPARNIKRLKVENRRTRILTAGGDPRCLSAQDARDRDAGADYGRHDWGVARAALGALPGWLRDVLGDEERPDAACIPISPTIEAVLAAQPRVHPWVFTNSRTEQPFKSVRQVFDRAVVRAGITTSDVTLHTLRHTALSRMIASGYDDYTVMEISGHSSTRMLARYTHPTEQRKVHALELPRVVTKRSQTENVDSSVADEIAELLKKSGGRQEARTPDLCVANAALSQLS
jgi:integrase